MPPPGSLHLLDHLQPLLFSREEAPYPIVQQVPAAALKNQRNRHKRIPTKKLAARSCINFPSLPLSLKCPISTFYQLTNFFFNSPSFLSAKMPDLVLHFYSLLLFPFLLFFLRLSWSSELLHRKQSLSWYLWSCHRKPDNADKLFGLEHWKIHLSQVRLLYYHPAGQSSFQRAECSACVVYLSMVSSSHLRHISDLTTEIHPQQLPSNLISHHKHDNWLFNIGFLQELTLTGSCPA